MAQAPRLIVFSDIDGTLLRDDKTIAPQTAQTIASASEAGVPFCPISARSPKGINPIWRALGFHGPLAAFSGGLVLDESGQTLYSSTIPLGDAIEIKAFLNCSLTGVVVNAFAFDTWVTDDTESPRVKAEENVVELKAEACSDLSQAFDDRGLHKFLLMGDPDDLTVAEDKIRERFPGLVVARSNANLVEVTSAGATKQHAIRVLCEHYNVSLEDAVAFGDGHNDIPMLKYVPVSYAVANASEEVKRAARFTCELDNNAGAVAETLRREYAHIIWG